VTPAALIADMLVAQGVRSVFSVAGASHARLLNALDRAGVNIISSRHEGGAVASADGYARVRRRLGVALIIADQGLPNAVGCLSAAFLANSPVLVLVAALPSGFVDKKTRVDHLALVKGITKWAGTVESADALGNDLRNAMSAALSGRPGPALLIMSGDQMTAELDWSGPFGPVSVAAPGAPDGAAIDRASDLLASAARPLLIAGAGAYWAGAGPGLRRLNEESGIPVTANGLGRGVLAENWTTCFSWPYAQIAAREADCVLLVGARLTQRLGFGVPPRFAADARFIQIDIAAEEAKRTRPIDVFINADAGAATDALADALARQPAAPRADRSSWLRDALRDRRARVHALITAARQPIHPLRLGAELARRIPAGSVYVGDGADIQSWMYGAVAITSAPGFMDHYPMGAMGIGTPLAVGAAAALRDEAGGREAPPVVLVTGDGSLGFYPAELHAAARAGLRVVVVVGNDGAWGTEVYEQRRTIGRDINTRLGALPYEKLAESFGCLGLRLERDEDIGAVLDQAFASRQTVLVNVIIDPEAGAELKSDPLLRMILFSDLEEGQKKLAVTGEND
jgi:acetolactate synthase-1/2/3 large subunit